MFIHKKIKHSIIPYFNDLSVKNEQSTQIAREKTPFMKTVIRLVFS
jgi:hypothetical protein